MTLAKCNEEAYLPILHLSRVELRCKLQEKLHREIEPLINMHVSKQTQRFKIPCY